MHAEMLIDLGEGYFTCKNWDPATRLCGIYETRPEMCRAYPEPGKVCGGCELVGQAKEAQR